MADHTPTTWYVMERLALPYDVATSALGTDVPVSSIEAATRGRLLVDAVHHARPGAVRGFVGRLRCGAFPWQIVRIEVGIDPWSSRESTVGVRPVARPPRAGAERYFESSLHVLGMLRDRLLDSPVSDTQPPSSAARRGTDSDRRTRAA